MTEDEQAVAPETTEQAAPTPAEAAPAPAPAAPPAATLPPIAAPAAPAAAPEPAAPEAASGGRFEYVVRPAEGLYHIYEQLTGKRITRFALESFHDAEQKANHYNREQLAP